jgi:disulfide bond formation protein DsbB
MDSQVFDNDTAFGEAGEQAAGSFEDTVIAWLDATLRHVALLAAWVAMCGSLFMSEVLGWQPCLLCWYQRILMYPLAVILAIGILRDDRKLHYYVLPFSIVGAGVSLYHYLLIRTDWFPPPACTLGISCTVDYINWLGFINIPLLALTAFLIITCSTGLWAWYQAPEDEFVDESLPAESVPSAMPRGRLLTRARLAVVVITVGVVLSFMLASTRV